MYVHKHNPYLGHYIFGAITKDGVKLRAYARHNSCNFDFYLSRVFKIILIRLGLVLLHD